MLTDGAMLVAIGRTMPMPARNLSDANEGREAACDAGRSLLPRIGL
jgi:hypothetical protein